MKGSLSLSYLYTIFGLLVEPVIEFDWLLHGGILHPSAFMFL